MKRMICTVTTLFIAFMCFAQVGDTTGRSEMAYLLQPLNANNIPTGYLMEWGTDMTDKDDLNGQITDSNFVNNMDLLRMTYADVYSAKYKTTAIAIPSVDALNTAIAAANINSLVLLYGQYATFDANALQAGKINYIGGRLYETGAGSPYLQKQVFAAYPRQAVFSNTVTLRYNPALYYNNTGVTVVSVQINWGAGYVNAPANTDISYTYTDSTGPKNVKIKAQLSNGQILQSQMIIKVAVGTGGSSKYTGIDLATTAPDITIPAQNGVHSGCRVYIRRNSATPAGKVLRPLVMVEGFDASSALPDMVPNYNVNDMVREINGINGENFNFQLDNTAGYDLVFIDWGNAVGDLPGNAVCLEQVLDALQAMKIANSQDNVLVGFSMGGLISRYCLADMVKRTPRKATHTRLLITMDSPHQGGYVPLSFQHLVTGLSVATGPLGISFGSIMNGALTSVKNNLLYSPAAQQQLKLLVTDANGTVTANTFLTNTYRPKITFTNPAIQPEYDFRAVSNGSQCGINLMAPGSSLATFSASANGTGAAITLQVLISWYLGHVPLAVITKLKYKMDLNANALTGNASHEILYFRLRREEKLFFVINNNKTFVEIHRNEPAFNTVPWESVPGGTEPLGDRLQLGTANLSNDWSALGPWFLSYSYSTTLAPSWSFVPVTSALDIQNPPTQNGQYIFPVNGQNGSTATRYIAQETTPNFSNSTHATFTSRNAQWFYEELQNIPHPPGDCRDICVASVTITGPATACSGTYTVPAVAGSTYDWQVTPTGSLFLVDPNSPSLSISTYRGAYGIFTVSVTIRNANGCITAIGTKTIELGLKPPYAAGPFDMQTHEQLIVGYTNVPYYFEAQETSTNYGPFTYTWTLTRPNNGTQTTYTGQSPTITFPVTGNYTLSLKKQSATCNNVTVSRIVVVQLAFKGLPVTVMPNPASTTVDITYGKNINQLGSNAPLSKSGSYQPLDDRLVSVNLYNQQGVRVIQKHNIGQKFSLDVSNLPKGIYIMEAINNEGKREIKRLIIQ